MPSTIQKKTSTAFRKQEAAIERIYEELEVDINAPTRHATITPIIVSSLGSISKAIDYLRGSDNRDALELIRRWDSVAVAYRDKVPFEVFCLAAKSTPKTMIGVLMQAVLEQGTLASDMMAAAAHPEIVKKTIKLAKTTRGGDERKIVLQKQGFMPAPKNQVFNNYGSVDNRKQQSINVNQLNSDDDKIAEAVERYDSASIKRNAEVTVVDILAEESDG
jgi:hypothetical protein